MNNGTNTWNVSFAHISWFENLLNGHGNVKALSRHDDLVFEVDRKQQADHLKIICLNEYTMGLTAAQRVIHEFGKPNLIYIGGGWCGYTPQAHKFCLSERIGLYVTDEMSGALWKADAWNYYKRNKEGDSIYNVRDGGA
ncbi:MAG: hypothetical protein P4L91_20665 [Burkholderiaceae bacterium]|nr:hypothetical protein [Burkholderiaceae bacterium]